MFAVPLTLHCQEDHYHTAINALLILKIEEPNRFIRLGVTDIKYLGCHALYKLRKFQTELYRIFSQEPEEQPPVKDGISKYKADW